MIIGNLFHSCSTIWCCSLISLKISSYCCGIWGTIHFRVCCYGKINFGVLSLLSCKSTPHHVLFLTHSYMMGQLKFCMQHWWPQKLWWEICTNDGLQVALSDGEELLVSLNTHITEHSYLLLQLHLQREHILTSPCLLLKHKHV